MKWNRVSICFKCSWWTGFLASAIADLLSTKIRVALLCFYCKSSIRFFNHIAWHTHDAITMYFASHVDNATIDYFFDVHMKAFSPIKKYKSNCTFSIFQVSYLVTITITCNFKILWRWIKQSIACSSFNKTKDPLCCLQMWTYWLLHISANQAHSKQNVWSSTC
jgi:hypothetical protein